jgi:hypothetical protein
MMKKINLIILIVVMAGIQSCTIFSLHPLYEESDLLEDPQLPGLWQDTEDGDEYVSFEKLEDKKYLFRYMEEQGKDGDQVILDTVSFKTGLLKIGDHFFLDLYPFYEGNRDKEYYLFRNFVPTHSFLKIEWQEGRMTLYMFDYERLKNLFEQNRIRIKHEMVDDYIVITASTPDLQRFIQKYADDKDAFDDPGHFKKIENVY